MAARSGDGVWAAGEVCGIEAVVTERAPGVRVICNTATDAPRARSALDPYSASHAHPSVEGLAPAPVGGAGVSTDVLSDVLRAVRLTGSAYFSVEARAPFAAEALP